MDSTLSSLDHIYRERAARGAQYSQERPQSYLPIKYIRGKGLVVYGNWIPNGEAEWNLGFSTSSYYWNQIFGERISVNHILPRTGGTQILVDTGLRPSGTAPLGNINEPWGDFFTQKISEPASGSIDLILTTTPTAGAVVEYLIVMVNGVSRRLPVHATS